jgi:hypothetical protein
MNPRKPVLIEKPICGITEAASIVSQNFDLAIRKTEDKITNFVLIKK